MALRRSRLSRQGGLVSTPSSSVCRRPPTSLMTESRQVPVVAPSYMPHTHTHTHTRTCSRHVTVDVGRARLTYLLNSFQTFLPYPLCVHAGVTDSDIITVYCSVIPTLLEYACPVFHTGLTKTCQKILNGFRI